MLERGLPRWAAIAGLFVLDVEKAAVILEVMKNMIRFALLLSVAAAAPAICGQARPASPGVAGVDVFVKQSPGTRAVTDARGSFVLDALPAGSYALTFRARKAPNNKSKTPDKVIIATTYTVKVEGAKRNITQSGLSTDVLIGGFEIPVQVAAGTKLRGQVVAGAMKRMVWIPKEPGSNIPGFWAEADSPEAKRAFKSHALGQSGDGLRKMLDHASDVHQEGFPNMPTLGGK